MDNSSTSSSSVLRRLIPRLILLAVLLWTADRGTGALLGHFHRRTVEGDFGGRINGALKQRNEIVILGSSRAKHHYIPKVIQEETGMSAFNAGFDAQTLLCHYGLEQLILDRYAPAVFVLEISTEDIRQSKERDALDKLSVLLPYYREGNPAMRNLLLHRSPFEAVKLLSRVYPYNSQILAIAKYTLSPDGEGSSRENGFVPYYGSDLQALVEVKKKMAQDRKALPGEDILNDVDPFVMQALSDFVKSARSQGVQVVASYSPLWMECGFDYPGQEKLFEYYKAQIRALDVPLIEISQESNPEFLDPQLFKDTIHLNNEGAKLFSSLFARKLKKALSGLATPEQHPASSTNF